MTPLVFISTVPTDHCLPKPRVLTKNSSQTAHSWREKQQLDPIGRIFLDAFILLINESKRYKSGMLETLAFTYLCTYLHKFRKYFKNNAIFIFRRNVQRKPLLPTATCVYVQFYRSFNPFSQTSYPESSAKVNDCISSLLKSSKWVLSAFSLASSSPQGDWAADKDLSLTYPRLFIVRYTVHFQNQLTSYGNYFIFTGSFHMEIILSFLSGLQSNWDWHGSLSLPHVMVRITSFPNHITSLWWWTAHAHWANSQARNNDEKQSKAI